MIVPSEVDRNAFGKSKTGASGAAVVYLLDFANAEVLRLTSPVRESD